jgi:hypothetical protein
LYYNCRVSGNINGVAIQEQELHCYIVTADGRTYTAISRIAPDIGWDIQVCQETDIGGELKLEQGAYIRF